MGQQIHRAIARCSARHQQSLSLFQLIAYTVWFVHSFIRSFLCALAWKRLPLNCCARFWIPNCSLTCLSFRRHERVFKWLSAMISLLQVPPLPAEEAIAPISFDKDKDKDKDKKAAEAKEKVCCD